MKAFDYENYKNWPSLQFVFKKLNDEGNILGRKSVSRLTDKYILLLGFICASDMPKRAKYEFYKILRDKSRAYLAGLNNLDEKDKCNVDNFLVGRCRWLMGKTGIEPRRQEATPLHKATLRSLDRVGRV